MFGLKQLLAIAAITSLNLVSAAKPIRFKPPFKAYDPNHHKAVFDHFRTCTATCTKSPTYAPYTDSSTAWDAFATLGGYTACVSTCIAHEILQLVTYYKSTYAKLLDITENQIRHTREYISGKEDFDFFGNRTRVGYSCCLPNEYFVEWSKVVIKVPAYFKDFSSGQPNSGPSELVIVRAEKWLNYCNNIGDGDGRDYDDMNVVDYGNGIGGLKFVCDLPTLLYLTQLKQTFGHNIIHPDYASAVPDGACTDRTNCHVALKPNPKAARFTSEFVCAAEKSLQYYANYYYSDEYKYTYLQDLIVRLPEANGDCPDLVLRSQVGNDFTTLTVSFVKVKSSSLHLFTVTGLPVDNGNTCDLQGELDPPASETTFSTNDNACAKNIDYAPYANPNSNDQRTAVYVLGGFEYCNADQYLNHLYYHTNFHGSCEGYEDINGLLDIRTDLQTGTTSKAFQNEPYTIACLYRIFSLRCDCMQAVLDCYTLHAEYSTALGKTLGRAASILCGFILCQRPQIYNLFLDAQGLAHTTILAEVLLQESGQLTSTLPIASMALVSFGLGMIAFFTAKQLAPRKKSSMEDGYANLI